MKWHKKKNKANTVRNMIINMKFDKTNQEMKPFCFVHLSFEHTGLCDPTLNDFCYNSRTT